MGIWEGRGILDRGNNPGKVRKWGKRKGFISLIRPVDRINGCRVKEEGQTVLKYTKRIMYGILMAVCVSGLSGCMNGKYRYEETMND